MAGGHLGTVWASVALDSLPFKHGAAEIRRELYALDATISRAGKGLGSAFMATAGQITVLAGVVAAASTKMAMDFETVIAKAGSVAEASDVQMSQWGDKVLEMSTKFAQSANEIGEALYWIKSDMPDATDSQQWNTLQVALKGATGGVAELEDATEALITTQNAYKGSKADLGSPEAYMDAMVVAVQRGSITLQDMVSNLGKVTSAAATADIPFTQIAAAASTLTRKGVPADTAMMALNQTIMAFYKPSKQAAETAKKYGLELSLTALRSKGLANALMEISTKVPDDELGRVFENIRALKAILPLTGNDMQDFNADMVAMAQSAGTTEEMFQTIAATGEQKLARSFNVVKKSMIEFGQDFIPLAADMGDAVSRIFEGKNETANAFFKVFGAGADEMENIISIAWDLRDVILKVGIAFAGIKLATGLEAEFLKLKAIMSLSSPATFTAAATGAQKLARSFAFLNAGGMSLSGTWLGVKQSAALAGGGIAGITTAIAPFAAAAAVGVGGGLALASVFRGIERRSNEAVDAIANFDKANVDLGMRMQPLIGRYAELRIKYNELTAAGEDATAVYQEMVSLSQQIADISPELVEGLDAQNNAILKNDDTLRLYIRDLLSASGITVAELGDFGNYQALSQYGAQLTKTKGIFEGYMGEIDKAVNVLERYDATGSDARNVVRLLSSDFEAGKKAAEAFRKQAEEAPGDLTNDEAVAVKMLTDTLASLGTAYATNGYTLDELRKKITQTDIALAQLRQSMIETARTQGFASGEDAMTDEMLRSIQSSIPAYRQQGLNMVAAVSEGMLQKRGILAADSGQLAQTITQKLSEGDYTSTGNEAADDVLAALRAKLGEETVAKTVEVTTQLKEDAANGSWLDRVKALWGGATITARADLDVTQLQQKKTEAEAQLAQLEALKKSPKVGLDTSGFDAKIEAIKKKLAELNAQIDVKSRSVVSRSPARYFDSWTKAGEYAGEGFTLGAQAGAGAINFTASVNGLDSWSGAGALAGDNIADDIARGYQYIQDAFSGVKSEMDAKPFDEVNAAIMGLTNNNWDLLGTWWGIQGTYDNVVNAFEDIQKQIKSLNKEIDVLTKNIAAPAKAYEQESNKLALAIMQAEDAYNYELAAKLQLQKDSIDRKKEELDLAAQISEYEANEGDNSKWLNMSASEISAQIAAWQKELAQKTLQVEALEIRYEDLQDSVDEFKKTIDDMNAYFKTLWADKQAGKVPAYALGTDWVAHTGLALVHQGEKIIPRNQNRHPQLTPMSMSTGETTVTTPVMLDGKVLTKVVTRIQGRNASAFARSGASY